MKSKRSEILIFSFYQDLLKDLSIDKENTVIELFKLFEDYLRSSKDKAFLFKNSSFDLLKELTEINKRFISAKTNQINNLIKQKKGFFKHYLQEIQKEELIFFIILITLSVVKILAGSTQKSQNNSPYVAPFAMIGSPTYTILRSSPEAPQSASHINMTLQTPEFHGRLRAKVQKITYTAPKMQPISSGTTKVGSPKNSPIKKLKTAPASLLLQNLSQTSQEVVQLENRVNQNRNYSNTTQVVINQAPTATNSGIQTKTHLLNSSGYYADLGKVQDVYKTEITETNAVLVPQSVPMDREHVTISPLLKGYTIDRDKGGTYFFIKSHHNTHTQVMAFELPDTCSYVSGSGNALDYHEELEKRYVIHLQNRYGSNPSPEYLLKNGTKAIDDLNKYGITQDKVIAAAKRAFGLDINTLYSMNIPADVLLPWSHVNSINVKQIDALNTFVESGDPGSSNSFNAQTLSGRLTAALQNGQDVNKHYAAVRQLLKPGSVEANIAERVHDKYLYGAREAVKAVEQKGGI